MVNYTSWKYFTTGELNPLIIAFPTVIATCEAQASILLEEDDIGWSTQSNTDYNTTQSTQAIHPVQANTPCRSFFIKEYTQVKYPSIMACPGTFSYFSTCIKRIRKILKIVMK